MGLRFALRGDSLVAWHSYSGNTSAPFGNVVDNPVVATNTSSGVFGERVINMVPTSVTKGLLFPGYGNVCAASGAVGFSVLGRLVPTASTTASTGFGVFECGNSRNPYGYSYRCGINSTGKAYVQLADLAGNLTTYIGSTTISVTADTPFDIMYSWGGTTTSAILISVDGAQIESLTSTNTAGTGKVQGVLSNIVVGTISGGATAGKINLNELLVWDSAGSVTYAARTEFWNVPQYAGHAVSASGGFGGRFGRR